MAGKSFLGTGWAFPPQFGHDGVHPATHMVSDERDIHESLVILLSTRQGERVLHPLYGSNLHTMVFEHLSETVETQIRALVVAAIARCEPRVTTELVTVHQDAIDPAILRIEIAYRVRATNSVHNLVYPFHTVTGALDAGFDR
ncbi:MAG: GPW/gp25 family protein [Gammaproteobacteria bacterium]